MNDKEVDAGYGTLKNRSSNCTGDDTWRK